MAQQLVSFNDRDLMESVKTLRTNIDFAGIEAPIKSLILTSAEKGDGKSLLASALAIAEAASKKKTLIIDNDFRSPQIANLFHVRGGFKLSTILHATSENLMDYCLETKYPNLFVLDLGSRRNDPVEVLSSKSYDKLVKTAIECFDFVIIDTPPLGMFIDAALVAPKTDGAIIVIRSGKDDVQSVRNVIGQLEKANARILGAVLNCSKKKHSDYYYYYSKKEHRNKKKAVH